MAKNTGTHKNCLAKPVYGKWYFSKTYRKT